MCHCVAGETDLVLRTADLDYTCYLMGVDWVLGVSMKITNALDHSGAHGDDKDQRVQVPGLF